MWLEHSKMLINEYRLDLMSESGQRIWMTELEKYFFGEGAQLPPDFVAPPRPSRAPGPWRSGRPRGAGFDRPGAVLLVSCYELGHQPFAVASPWAQLERAGLRRRRASTPRSSRSTTTPSRAPGSSPSRSRCTPRCASAAPIAAPRPRAEPGARTSASSASTRRSTPSTSSAGHRRLGHRRRVRVRAGRARPRARGAAAGARRRRRHHARRALARPARAPSRRPCSAASPSSRPRRDGLPALDRYARLIGPAPGEERVVGYVEASRGCLHRCLPLPDHAGVRRPLLRRPARGRPRRRRAADRRGRAAHHLRRSRLLQRRRPLAWPSPARSTRRTPRSPSTSPPRSSTSCGTASASPSSRALGCVFVVSAVESLSDRVLAELDKGHTRADVFEALRHHARRRASRCARRWWRSRPWTTLDDYLELCDFIVERGPRGERRSHPARHPPAHPAGLGAARGATRRAPGSARSSRTSSATAGRTPIPRMDRLHEEVSRRVEEGAARGEDADGHLRRHPRARLPRRRPRAARRSPRSRAARLRPAPHRALVLLRRADPRAARPGGQPRGALSSCCSC